MEQIFHQCLSQRVIRRTWSDESDNDFLSPLPSPSPSLSTFPDAAVAFSFLHFNALSLVSDALQGSRAVKDK